MRVCHLIDHMGAGGAQSMLVDLLETHSERFDASIVALRDSGQADVDGELARFGGTYSSLGLSRFSVFAPLHIRAALKRGSYALVHTHLDFANTLGVVAALTLGRKRPLIVAHIHNDPWQQNSAIFRAVTGSIAARIDAHIVPTPSLVAVTASALGHRARKIQAIWPGIDAERFSRVARDTQSTRELRGGAKFVIGFAGRLVEQKRLDRLLAALPEILKAEPSTRLLVAGDGPLRGVYESLCRQLGIENAVHFLGHRRDMAEVYAAMDVFVLVSAYESFGIVLAEAQAAGLPVVATAIPCVTDFVTDGETGLLVSPDDGGTLAGAILRLLNNDELQRKLAGAAQAMVLQRFTREAMARRMEALYDGLRSADNPAAGS